MGSEDEKGNQGRRAEGVASPGSGRLRGVGLWINAAKPHARMMAGRIEEWLEAGKWRLVKEPRLMAEEKVEFVISLGGDGTLLEAARAMAAPGIPVLGVNLGRLGFLCEIEKEEIFPALTKVLAGEYKLQRRLMLNAVAETAGKTVQYTVLNDVVFARDQNCGLVTLQANLAGEPSVSYPADGMIIATPTGSTAYSLSAGGPIVSPEVEAILLTPLAAHSLSARPMILSCDEEIEILMARGEKCRVTFDGQEELYLHPGERVKVQRSPLRGLLIRLGRRSFPAVVREKLMDRWHD
ncbi:NAD kinase [Peptococcaceae bacterium CEB3]|nr:NAD kinase [Peptococcaceae bacterium CEB3]